MPYNSGSKKGQLNRSDVKKLWIEKTGESPPTSWNRDKIMSELEQKKEKKVKVKDEPEVIEKVNHVLETVESVEVPVEVIVEPKKKARKKKI